jgi:3-oxoacyl-[acyl-carrier-protein] synthase III
MGLKIMQTANYVPPKVVTNDDLAAMMDTSDEWISSRTHIKQRHIAQNEQTSDLAIKVAKRLLQKAHLSPNQLDFIIVATMSPDYLTPSTAAIVQGRIHADHAFAFDINVACSGFIYALSIADKLLAGSYQRGIVIGAEVLSKLVDWHDRSTAILFGDGCGGVLVESNKLIHGVMAEDLTCFGENSQVLTAGYNPLNSPFNDDKTSVHRKYFEMDGREVYRFATHEVPKSIKRVLAKARWQSEQVDWYLLHQANGRIVTTIAQRLEEDETKFLSDVAKFGNTSAASIAILLDEAVSTGKIQTGQKLILSGFGGGLTVASIALIF